MDKKEFKNRLHYGEEVTAVHINKDVFYEAILSGLNNGKSLKNILPKHKILQKQVENDTNKFLKNIRKIVVDINDNFDTFYLLIQSIDNSAICISYKNGVSEPSISYLSSNEQIIDYYNTELFTLCLKNYINLSRKYNYYELTEIFGLGKVSIIKNSLKHNIFHLRKSDGYKSIKKYKLPKNKIKTFNTLASIALILTLFTIYTIIQVSDSQVNITSRMLR